MTTREPPVSDQPAASPSSQPEETRRRVLAKILKAGVLAAPAVMTLAPNKSAAASGGASGGS